MFQVTFDILVMSSSPPTPQPPSPRNRPAGSHLGVFWPKRGLQANHVTVRKGIIFYSRNQATKNSLNEATLLMSMK